MYPPLDISHKNNDAIPVAFFQYGMMNTVCWEIRLEITLYIDRVLLYTRYYVDTI